MKQYLFNAENGLYAGETFEDGGILDEEDGMTTVPPPRYAQGEVPVFDRTRQQWVVIPVTVARQLLGGAAAPVQEN